MGNLNEKLMEELECKEVFSFDFFGYTAHISEAVVVTWIIMAVLILIAIILGSLKL